MRIGFFGGSFDPIHIGHVGVAREVRCETRLDVVLVAPAADPYLRENSPSAGPEERFEMVAAAISGVEGLEASRIDIDRPGPTYTIDSVEAIREEYGRDAEVFVILGVDAAESVKRWHRSEDLLTGCILVVVGRPGRADDLSDAEDRRAWAQFHGLPDDFIYIEGPMLPASSTEIRRMIRAGEPVDHLVPGGALRIIRARGLYR